jgi:hypothetical protein
MNSLIRESYRSAIVYCSAIVLATRIAVKLLTGSAGALARNERGGRTLLLVGDAKRKAARLGGLSRTGGLIAPVF